MLSGASSSFVPSTLKWIKVVSLYLPLNDLERWITHAFDLLDSPGTEAFVRFTSETDEESLRKFRNPEGLHLHDAVTVLEAYLRGISGMELKIAPAKYPYTDTSKVFLPSFINRYPDNRRNFFPRNIFCTLPGKGTGTGYVQHP